MILKHMSFGYPSEMSDFINRKKIKKENIQAMFFGKYFFELYYWE